MNNDKIDEVLRAVRKKLMKRKSRFDAEKGEWITTKKGHKVHLNENGVPDKGNPHVIEKMKGNAGDEDVAKENKKVAKEWTDANAEVERLGRELDKAKTDEEFDQINKKRKEAQKKLNDLEKKLKETNKKLKEQGYIWNEESGEYEKPGEKSGKKQTAKKKTSSKEKSPKEEPAKEEPTKEEPAKEEPVKQEVAEEKAGGGEQAKGSTNESGTEENRGINQAGSGKAGMKVTSRKDVFKSDAYSEERKNNVANVGTPEEVDGLVRGKCSEVWKNMSEEEQRSAIMYTRFSGLFNKEIREAGAEGKTEIEDESIRRLTDVVSRSTYDFDMSLQRGMSYSGTAKFLGVSEDLLEKGSAEELADLKGAVAVEYAFTSTGAAKGYGTTPEDKKEYKVQYNIYAPAGTQMLYCEPFSWYNNENKTAQETQDWWDFNWWDGESKQKDGYSREFEMLIQRNTKYRVSGARRDKDGVVWIDMEVIGQGDD